jgi:hypothetical protein
MGRAKQEAMQKSNEAMEHVDGEVLAEEVKAYIERCVQRFGTTVAIKPSHRVKFHWPPHPISYSFHVVASDWTGSTSFEAHGETFDVKVAKTPFGVFGRCDAIWHEDRGGTEEEMINNLRASSEPLFHRQLRIHRTLEREGRFTGHISELPALSLCKLLFCEDRDVANDARTEIEVRASRVPFLPALLAILEDRRHPHRRSAQWCVLDLFEDLPSYCRQEGDDWVAVEAMKRLLMDAEDDYARTVYKAGVVLGGHLPGTFGGPALLECIHAKHRIGRRSAIHGLFHVVEWMPEMRETVAAALHEHSLHETDPQLKEFSEAMAIDIAEAKLDHISEPVFDDER